MVTQAFKLTDNDTSDSKQTAFHLVETAAATDSSTGSRTRLPNLTQVIDNLRQSLTGASVLGIMGTSLAHDSINYLSSGQNAVSSRFENLTASWRAERQPGQDLHRSMMLPSYQKIIGMGFPVVPHLLKELQHNPLDWVWALYAITDANPVSSDDAGNIGKIQSAWISWGRRNYLI